MSEFKVFMGLDQMKYMNALLKHSAEPTEENKKSVEEAYKPILESLTKSQAKKVEEFVALYGQEMFDFVQSLSKGYFLVGKDAPFYLSFEVKADYDNDNYWMIKFKNGKFNYILDICGGYGGSEEIETNLSKERVLQLLNDESE